MALRPQVDGDRGQRQSKNQIREVLRSLFRDRDCYTLVRPVTEEQDLQSMSSLPTGKLRQEFQSQMAALRKYILSRVQPKILNNKTMSGNS